MCHTVATFSNGVVIPELVYICFQMTFACITAALVLGGVAERMKFAAVLVFVLATIDFDVTAKAVVAMGIMIPVGFLLGYGFAAHLCNQV